MDSIKYQQTKKNQNLTPSPRNLIMDHPSGQWSKTNIKINTKICYGPQNESSAMTVPVPWPDEWSELKRRSTNMDLGICRI